MYKIFALLTIVYFIPALSFAQFATGQKLIGGNLSFSTSSGNSTPSLFDNRNIYRNHNTGIVINPSIARFFKPAVLHGIGVIYNYNHYSIKEELPGNGNNFSNKAYSVGLNIFSQRFISLGNNFFFTVLTGGTPSYSSGKQYDVMSKATARVKGYSINIALTPGLSYKINNRFLFDAFLSNLFYAGYQHSITTSNYPVARETKTYNNSFYITSSLSNTALGILD